MDTFGEGVVKQTKTTVNYRFSQPDQSMPLILPQSYSTGRVIRIPAKPQTVGDHIRRKRLGLKLLQREVAEQFGVTASSVANWEANAVEPEIRYMPAIIGFLGYDPLPPTNTLAEQLVRQRRRRGMSQEESARELCRTPPD